MLFFFFMVVSAFFALFFVFFALSLVFSSCSQYVLRCKLSSLLQLSPSFLSIVSPCFFMLSAISVTLHPFPSPILPFFFIPSIHFLQFPSSRSSFLSVTSSMLSTLFHHSGHPNAPNLSYFPSTRWQAHLSLREAAFQTHYRSVNIVRPVWVTRVRYLISRTI